MKPKNKKEVEKILLSNGFKLICVKKHEKWSNGISTVLLPKKHKEFHVIGHYKILKSVGIVS